MPADTPVPVLIVHYGGRALRGSERCLLDLLARVDRRRFAPSLWCNAPPLADAARSLDVPVACSAFEPLRAGCAPSATPGQWFRQVATGRRLLRRSGARVIHANSAAPVQWLLPTARLHRVPLLCHLHGFYHAAERYALGVHQATLVVGVSEAVLEGLREDRMPEARLRCIPNGVDAQRLCADGPPPAPPAGAGDSLRLATIGALIPRKGMDLIIEGLAQARRRGVRVQLLIVGDGPERTALERLSLSLGVNNAVEFAGWRADVGAILRERVDVLVSAARAEAFGLTLIEAGACGVPAIVTDTGGMREVVCHGESGLVVPPENAAAIAGAIEQLWRSPAQRTRLGAAACARALGEYSVTRYVEQVQDAWDGLAGRAGHAESVLGPWRCLDALPQHALRRVGRRRRTAGRRGGGLAAATGATGTDSRP